MKRFLSLLLILVLVFSLASCHSPKEEIPEEEDEVVDVQPENDDEAVENNAEEEPVDNQIDEDVVNVDVPPYDPCLDYGLPIPTKTIAYDDGNKLILVNKQYAVTPDFYPTNLVAVDGSLSTNKGLYLKKEAYDAYLNMLADANEQGINFLICSTYRSYGTQESIYFDHIYYHGIDYTNTVSAYPGRSEHHTGWAIDITSKSMGYDLLESFINYPEGQWINDHCHEYGFIIRYPQGKTHITGYAYEPWHLRYVGVDVATQIMSQGLTLEEYLGVA